MLNEFKAFIAKGNVVDLAVGIIIGAAFTAIVNSLVADLINPIIGLITGGVDFSNLFIDMSGTAPVSLAAAKDWVVFLLVKAVNRLKEATAKKEAEAAAAAPAGPSELDVLLEIRDALKK